MRVIQYSETPVIESRGRGVLDTPQEPVIGRAEGETRWRGMTETTGLTDLPDGLFGEHRVQPLLQKYFAFPVGQIKSTTRAIPSP